MNEEDQEIAKRWDKEGLIEFRRIPFKQIKQDTQYPQTHSVYFTDEALDLVAACRRERAMRHNRQHEEGPGAVCQKA